MKNIKKMNITEFVEEGYLQEVNRRFFHPLGLALEVLELDNGTEVLGGIWDFRDDPEGLVFDESITGKPEYKRKAENIQHKLDKRKNAREKLLGFFIQPVR